MWKFLLLAVLTNSFFLSLGTHLNRCQYEREGRCYDISEGAYSNDSDSEEDSEEDNEIDSEESDNNYTGGCSTKYPGGCLNNYPGEASDNNEYDSDCSYCADALDKFNDGVFCSGLQLFKTYLDSSPEEEQEEPPVFSPLGTLMTLAPLAIFGKGKTEAEVYAFLNLSNRKQVASETCNKITNIIEDNCILNRSTELVRISASYFSTSCEIELEISKRITLFRIAPDECVPVTFYTQVAVYEYADSSELKSKAVRLYYKDRKFNILLILPDEPFTVDKLLDRMSANPTGWYKRLCNDLKPTKVEVIIPAGTPQSFIDTRAVLMEGSNLETIYSGETIQLKGAIKGDRQAGVSIGLQKNLFNLSSKGGPVKNLPKGKAVEFLADTPHLFFVFITSTNTPLYFGYTTYGSTSQRYD